MPNKPYINRVPVATEPPANSPPNFNMNFQSINELIDVDHYSFNINNGGWHKQSTYAEPLGADPNMAAPKSSVYTKTINGQSELFFQNGAAPVNARQITGLPVSAATNGYTYLPSGIILQWGVSNVTNAGNTVNFSAHFPHNCFNIQLTPYDPNPHYAVVIPGTITLDNFQARTDKAVTVYWFAIGN